MSISYYFKILKIIILINLYYFHIYYYIIIIKNNVDVNNSIYLIVLYDKILKIKKINMAILYLTYFTTIVANWLCGPTIFKILIRITLI